MCRKHRDIIHEFHCAAKKLIWNINESNEMKLKQNGIIFRSFLSQKMNGLF